ncbi:HEPN domain-containing protein [Acidovorax sp. LjRoot66]|uniref:HEPN domain-containing protein n=1 Tax=Acidovorax sp. LjRoot66 TaxID=3342334 RepID=UPI003ECE22B2
MASSAFLILENNLHNLKAIYLDASMGAVLPSLEQSELARAFVVLAHAEIEYFVETIFEDLCKDVQTNALNGKYISSSLALITYSNIEQLAAGAILIGQRNEKRILSKRFGEAFGKYRDIITENHGIREKYLAKLAIPMGLSGDKVDPTWKIDLESFCDLRGAFAHKARTFSMASPASVNPNDVWAKCQLLVWGNPSLSTGLISSFKDIDAWVSWQRGNFGASFNGTPAHPTWRIKNLFSWIIK